MDIPIIHSKEKNEMKIEISTKRNMYDYIDSIFRVRSNHILKPIRMEFFNDKVYVIFQEKKSFSELRPEKITKEMIKKMPLDLFQGSYDFHHYTGKLPTLTEHIYFDEETNNFLIFPLTFSKIDLTQENIERYVLTQIYNIFIDMKIYLSPEFESTTELLLRKDYPIENTFPLKQYLKLLFLDQDEMLLLPDMFETYQDKSCEFVFLMLELFLRCTVEKENFINKNIKYSLYDIEKIVNSTLKNQENSAMENSHLLNILKIIGFDIKTSLFYRHRMDELAAIYLQNISKMDFKNYFRTDYINNVKFEKNSFLNSTRNITFKEFVQTIFRLV